eukprot:gnl/Dysnectes_brevis/6015_a9022_320.p1 GENE.gnl/Dysnectes_brevis/6015_a9022_320~~gnl/Dysnectes_brevis/6015_a9022_320.p1  ORF type:complete len:1138 (+),score=99.33 gnl/Dysnectes_brevis/6015_a9022_320:348-3416(+)
MSSEEQMQIKRLAFLQDLNKPWTIDAVNMILPKEGFKVLKHPSSHKQNRSSSIKLQMKSKSSMSKPSLPIHPLLQPTGLNREQVQELFRLSTTSGTGITSEVPSGEEMTKWVPEGQKDTAERDIEAFLVRLRSGSGSITDKRSAFKALNRLCPHPWTADLLLPPLLKAIQSPGLDEQQHHLHIRALDRIITLAGIELGPHVPQILSAVLHTLIDSDRIARQEGQELLSKLANTVGLAPMLSALAPDFHSSHEYARNIAARGLALVALATSPEKLLRLLRAVCTSPGSWEPRQTGFRAIRHMAIYGGSAIQPHMASLALLVEEGLRDETPQVRRSSVDATSSMGRSAFPNGWNELKQLLPGLWESFRRSGRARDRAHALLALSQMSLLNPDEASRSSLGHRVGTELINIYHECELTVRRPALQATALLLGVNPRREGGPTGARRASTAPLTPKFAREKLLGPFFNTFWTRRVVTEAPSGGRSSDRDPRRLWTPLIDSTVSLGTLIGPENCVRALRPVLGVSGQLGVLASRAMSLLINTSGVGPLQDRDVKLLCETLIELVTKQQRRFETSIVDCIGDVMEALGTRAFAYLPGMSAQIQICSSMASPATRQTGSALLCRLSTLLSKCDPTRLSRLGTIVSEGLSEEYPEALASVIDALTATFSALEDVNIKMQPPVEELLPRITPVLRNTSEVVQQACVKFVGVIAQRCGDAVPIAEWLRISNQLLEMFGTRRTRSLQKACISSLGSISTAVGPHHIVDGLLTNLRLPSRQSRLGATISLGVIADNSGPFVVIPFLMREYASVPDKGVQMGVLKAMGYMFETIGEAGRDYIYPCLTMVVDALTNRDEHLRHTACEVCAHIAVSCAHTGVHEALLHLLNHVMPNILEKAPHLIQNVLRAFQACSLAVGPGVAANYVRAGLFHPARRVREMYWRLNNILSIDSRVGMVPQFPRLDALDAPLPGAEIVRRSQQQASVRIPRLFENQMGTSLAAVKDENELGVSAQISESTPGAPRMTLGRPELFDIL